MTSPADQIANKLPNTVVGGATGWTLVIGKAPGEPAKVVCFFDTGGPPPHPSLLLDFRSVQVLVRGQANEYNDAYTKAQQVKDVLLGITPETLGTGDRIDGITMLSDIAFLNYDDLSRPTFSVNFRVFWEPVTNSLTNREPL